jgi:hypothetical protein
VQLISERYERRMHNHSHQVQLISQRYERQKGKAAI